MYASCDVFVFPSTTDTLGRAVAEAQASGLPAVVRGMGGPRECIRPGVSGFVADPGDEEGFLSKIELLLEDPAQGKDGLRGQGVRRGHEVAGRAGRPDRASLQARRDRARARRRRARKIK